MKRIICIFFIAAVVLDGCTQRKYPTDTRLEGSRWVAEEADVYLDISNKYYEDGITNSRGNMVTKEKKLFLHCHNAKWSVEFLC